MNSKAVLHIFAAATLVASVLAAPAAYALDVPATIDYISLTESSQSAAIPVLGWTESPLWLPRSDEIDQNQPSGTAYIAAFSQGDLAQSFVQTHNNISGAGILLQATGSTGNVTIQLWTGLPNAGGTMVTSASASGTPGQWVDVFWDDVDVTPITYYLVFLDGTMGIAGSTTNPYPNGMCYANTGFQAWPGFDYAFRTYYDTDVSLELTTWASVKSLFN